LEERRGETHRERVLGGNVALNGFGPFVAKLWRFELDASHRRHRVNTTNLQPVFSAQPASATSSVLFIIITIINILSWPK